MIDRFLILSEFMKEMYITILSFLPWTIAGSGRSYSSFLLPQLESSNSDIHVTFYESSWIASIVLFSTPFGCIIGAIVQDTIGRKLGIQAPFIPFTFAWALIAFSSNVYMIYVGMGLNGIATGMSFGSIVYVGEISSPKRRGSLGALVLTMLSLGIFLTYILTYLFAWRICAICFMVLSITSFAVLYLLPESPVWLVTKGKSDEAYKVLLWLRDSESDAVQNLQEAQRQEKTASKNKKSLKDILIGLYDCKKMLIIANTLAVLQQPGGFLILMAYCNLFFDSLEIPFESSLASIIFSIDLFVVSFLLPVVVEKMNRRTAQIWAGISLVCCWLIVMGYEILYQHSEDKPIYWIVLVAMFISVVPASFLCMCLPLIVSGEIIGGETKGICVGILGIFIYVSGGLCVKLYPYILNSYGLIATLGIFIFFCGLNIPYGIFVLPETQGKTLEEIQEEYFRKDKKLLSSCKQLEKC